MTVRRGKKKPPPEPARAPEPAPVPIDGDDISLEESSLYSRVKIMLITDGRPRTIAFLREQRRLSLDAAKSLVERVNRHYRGLSKDWAPTSREDQIFFVRHRLGAIVAAREAERTAFREARRTNTKYVPDPNLPSMGEERGWQELLARLEGNFAPTKIRVSSDEFDEKLLALLKVSSSSQVRALIEEGRKIVEAQGYEVPDHAGR